MIVRWNRYRLIAVALAVLATTAIPVFAEDEAPEKAKPTHTKPYLWVVEGPTRVFLFGTIHVPEKRVLDLPKIVTSAFEASDTLTTEMPMDMASLMKANQLSAKLSALPVGETLGDVLPEGLRDRIDALLPKITPVSSLDGRQPWFVWLTLVQVQMMPYMGAGMPLDMLLYSQAQGAGKKVGGIESATDQLSIFAELTMAEQVELLSTAVKDFEDAKEKGTDSVAVLLDLYLEGDENALMEEMNKAWDPEDPLGRKLRERAVDGRNVTMANAVLKLIEEQPDKTHFVAVGAGHLAGKKGIPSLLEEKGYTVRRLKVGDPLPQPAEIVAPQGDGSGSGAGR